MKIKYSTKDKTLIDVDTERSKEELLFGWFISIITLMGVAFIAELVGMLIAILYLL